MVIIISVLWIFVFVFCAMYFIPDVQDEVKDE
jgi:hypothetical protein